MQIHVIATEFLDRQILYYSIECSNQSTEALMLTPPNTIYLQRLFATITSHWCSTRFFVKNGMAKPKVNKYCTHILIYLEHQKAPHAETHTVNYLLNGKLLQPSCYICTYPTKHFTMSQGVNKVIPFFFLQQCCQNVPIDVILLIQLIAYLVLQTVNTGQEKTIYGAMPLSLSSPFEHSLNNQQLSLKVETDKQTIHSTCGDLWSFQKTDLALLKFPGTRIG